MSTPTITVKRHDHRLYICDAAKEDALLSHLIAKHSGKNILVAASRPVKNDDIANNANVTFMLDDAIMGSSDLHFDILISFDLPEKALHYMKRLACAKESASPWNSAIPRCLAPFRVFIATTPTSCFAARSMITPSLGQVP